MKTGATKIRKIFSVDHMKLSIKSVIMTLPVYPFSISRLTKYIFNFAIHFNFCFRISHALDKNIPFHRCLRFFYPGLLSQPRL